MNNTMDEFVTFARFVAAAIMDEEFEDNAFAYVELFCRRLRSLGIVTDDDKNWNFTPTNADYIRAMTDEELATFLGFVIQDGYCYGVGLRNELKVIPVSEHREMIEWLKSEAKDA